MRDMVAGNLWTIGHSNHPLPLFLELLKAHEIALLVDVRTIPRSGYNPQFSLQPLARALKQVGIEYRHMPVLGGMRQPQANSSNRGWKAGGFRGYADYMQTREFEQALGTLMMRARAARVVIMCAEGDPLKCHRQLISDAVALRRGRVLHIVPGQPPLPHEVTAFARATECGCVTYPDAYETHDLFAAV